MCRILTVLAVLAVAAVPLSSPAQNGYGMRESVEPPLADNPKADEIIQLAKAQQQGRPYVPPVRTVDVPAPAVVLRMQAPTALVVSQNVEIRMTVENVSRALAKNVVVYCTLPAGAGQAKAAVPAPTTAAGLELAWKFDKLDPAERKEIVLTVAAQAGSADLVTKGRVVIEQEQSTKTTFAQGKLVVVKTVPPKAQRFDIMVFGLDVSNTGTVDLSNVTVSDRVPAGLVHRPDGDAGSIISPDGATRTWKIDRLAAGQIRRLQYQVAAATAPVGKYDLSTTATADGNITVTDAKSVVLIDLKLELKAEAPPRISATVPATVKFTLTNGGQRALQNIVVTDLLDPCKLDNVGGGGQDLSDHGTGHGTGRVQWIVPTLGSKQSKVFDLVVSKSDGGVVRQKITAVYRGMPVSAEAQTEFDAVAALAYDFRGTPTTVEVGSEVVYEINVRNSGAAAATNIRPSIELPPELTLVKAEPENKVAGGKVTFEPIPKLAPNDRATFRVTAKAVKPSVGAHVQAELGGDPFPTGAIKRQEVTAIGASPAAPPAPVPAGNVPLPVPVAPPMKP
jgi:uncharacterized repeat protein (TIGR01451 family)